MPKVAVYNMEGVQIGDIELNNAIFGVKINEGLMHQAVLSHLAKRRQGTAATKNRSQVSGGRKPWRQRTGRARVGSIRSPLWVGGGVVSGLHPGIMHSTCRKRHGAWLLNLHCQPKFAMVN